LEKIQINGTKEKEVRKKLKKKNSQSWEEDKIVYMDERIYVPNSQKIKKKILQKNHEPVDIGHPEQQRIMDLIKKTTGGWKSRTMSKNMFKNVSNANRTKYNT